MLPGRRGNLLRGQPAAVGIVDDGARRILIRYAGDFRQSPAFPPSTANPAVTNATTAVAGSVDNPGTLGSAVFSCLAVVLEQGAAALPAGAVGGATFSLAAVIPGRGAARRLPVRFPRPAAPAAELPDNPLRLPSDHHIYVGILQYFPGHDAYVGPHDRREGLRGRRLHEGGDVQVMGQGGRAGGPEGGVGPPRGDPGLQVPDGEPQGGEIDAVHLMAAAGEKGRGRRQGHRRPLGCPDARLLGAAPLPGESPAVRRRRIE
ncbi:MAG: hypothetical protein BWX68_03084 [Verrucomicrobia bacterium ADurb.Bin063]|nr:MAG: hypothetical protein BWX68_03084 [Verrucomicrobia bacterium ADurb.Bin063]